MTEVRLDVATKMTKELVEAVEILRKENSRIADKNLHLQSEVDNLKKKLDLAGNRVDQLLTENDTLSEALKNTREQLKELEYYKEKEAANSEFYRLLNNAEKEKCALCSEIEQLKQQVELLKDGAIERLIESCSFEVKFNVKSDS